MYFTATYSKPKGFITNKFLIFSNSIISSVSPSMALILELLYQYCHISNYPIW